MQNGSNNASTHQILEDAIFQLIPMEIWLEIAFYLDEKALAALKLVCQYTRNISNYDLLWQCFLDQLHKLDSNVPRIPPTNAPSSWRQVNFRENFKRIDNKQLEKILELLTLNANGQLNLESEVQKLLLKMNKSAKCLADLEERHRFLSPEAEAVDLLIDILLVETKDTSDSITYSFSKMALAQEEKNSLSKSDTAEEGSKLICYKK